MKNTETTKESEAAAPVKKHIDTIEDACATAAYRINVVIALLRTAENRDSSDADDDGGHGLYTAEDMLREIRDSLRESLHAEGERQRAASGGVK